MTLHDKFGRQITDLRISITDRCNFRCVYCRSADPENYRDHDEILSWPELDRLAKIFLSLGIRKIRITGGEPLVREGVVDSIARLHALGVEDLSQTTNGHQVYFRNGNPIGSSSHNIQPGVVDTHSWYDSDVSTGDTIHYVYSQLLDIHSLVAAPLKGIVPITARTTNAGATTITCFMLAIDGVTYFDFDDGSELHTMQLDTRHLSNGTHILQFMGEGTARSGKTLRGQVEVPIVVAN